jgi:F0F1-type ATP synthase membrane subunit c/vacuolar-type H+-ATPase subunit K
MPEAHPSEPTPQEKRLDRQLLGSMALSVFAGAFEVIVGFCVAHWITITSSKQSGYLIAAIAFCICVVAGWMASHVRGQVTQADETRPRQERQLFMANLNLLVAGLVSLLVIAGTLVLVTLRPDS